MAKVCRKIVTLHSYLEGINCSKNYDTWIGKSRILVLYAPIFAVALSQVVAEIFSIKVGKPPQMVQAVKRTAEAVFERKGIIRAFENIGQRRLPYKMFGHGDRFMEGNYFIMHFDTPAESLLPLREHMSRDLDIIKQSVLRKEVEVGRPCNERPCDFGETTEEMISRHKRDIKKFMQKL